MNNPSAKSWFNDLLKIFVVSESTQWFVRVTSFLQTIVIILLENLSGVLQQLAIPKQMYKYIAVVFITNLPQTSIDFDTIWVVVDYLTKTTHFFAIKGTIKIEKLTNISERQSDYTVCQYLSSRIEIVNLHPYFGCHYKGPQEPNLI